MPAVTIEEVERFHHPRVEATGNVIRDFADNVLAIF